MGRETLTTIRKGDRWAVVHPHHLTNPTTDLTQGVFGPGMGKLAEPRSSRGSLIPDLPVVGGEFETSLRLFVDVLPDDPERLVVLEHLA